MYQLNLKNGSNLKNILPAFIGISLFVLLNKDIWILFILLLVLTGIFLHEKRFFILISFFLFIVAVSSLSATLRTVIQIFNIFFLIYYFIKGYGLDINKYPNVPNSVIYLVSTLLIVMCFSILFSDYPHDGYPQLIRTIIFFLIIYLYYSLLVYTKDIELFIKAFLTTAVFIFIVLLYFLYTNDFNIIQFNTSFLMEKDNYFINKNAIGAFFVISISILTPFLFYNYLYRKKIIIFSLILLLLFGLFITNSRAAILSLIISIIFILFVLNKRLLIKFAVILLLLTSLIFIQPIYDFIELYFRLESISTGRDLIYEATSSVIKNNLIFGSGPAGTKYEMYKYLPFLIGSPQENFLSNHIQQNEFGHAHNFYLFFLSDMGLLGLIISFLLPAIFLTIAIKTLNMLKGGSNRSYYLIIGSTGAGIAMFIRGMFEWGGLITYGTISADLPFWWIFCILIFIYTQNKNNKLRMTKYLST